MESIEFTADIQNGIIKLPDEYKNLPKKAKIKIIFKGGIHFAGLQNSINDFSM